MEDSDPDSLLAAIIEKLNEKGVAFLEMNEGYYIKGAADNNIDNLKDLFCRKHKSTFKGTWISNNGYTKEKAEAHINEGIADMVSFGWLYVANNDLVEKFGSGAPLNNAIYAKENILFTQLAYGKGPRGYTDLSDYVPK